MAAEDTSPEGVARTLLHEAVALKRDENLTIETWSHTLPYAIACVVEGRRIGASPLLHLEDEAAYWKAVDSGVPPKQIGRVGAHEWAALAKTNVYVFFPGPADFPRLNNLPAATRAALQGYNSDWYRRAKLARIRGVRSMIGYASDPRAEQFGVSAAAWRAQLARATTGTEYGAVRADAKRVAAKLRKGKQLRVTAANGTDLSLKLRGRIPIADDGAIGPEDVRAGNNVAVAPPGYVAVAVDERSAEGIAIANRPTFWRKGRLEGGQWEAHQGRLANHWYTEGQTIFDTSFEEAPKGKDVLGFFSIGLNPALDPAVPMVEDQEAGAVTIGLGGNAGYGGTNRCPFLTWIVVGEATVAVDGTPLSDRGKVL
ncbi:MAG TPA: hypothetical protein VFF67_04205 [Thermoplasmata archaeon]|nr:hypothetical protein [Thermoplasmata archaeon]